MYSENDIYRLSVLHCMYREAPHSNYCNYFKGDCNLYAECEGDPQAFEELLEERMKERDEIDGCD